MSKERELLRRALGFLENDGRVKHPLTRDIIAYLASKPEAEPVTDEILEQHIENSDGRWVDGEFRIDGPDLMSLLRAVSKPAKPARKPMTEEEIEDIYYSGLTFENTYLAAFVEGFRQAEKHHGIGGDDE